MLVKEAHRALYVSDLGEHEHGLGLRLNMPLANAKAIAPDIAHYLHDDEYFKKILVSFAYAAMRFSPKVAIGDDYGLLLNISGCAHLFGGEQKMLMAIDAFFARAGFHTKKAIAESPLLAKALAYFSSEKIVDGNIKAHIKPLPIDALFIDSKTRDTLNDLGIVSLGALLKMPKKMLLTRFGIGLLQRLDQLSGDIHVPLAYLEEKPKFSFGEHFTSPIRSHEHFMQAALVLINKALEKLEEHHFSLSSMTIFLSDTFKKITKLTIEPSRSSNRREQWLELLFLKTQNMRFNDGLNSLKLVLTKFERSTFSQTDFSKKNDDRSVNLCHITDKLKSRLGEHAIFHLRLTAKHIPEHAVKRDFSLKMNNDIDGHVNLPPRPLRLLKKPIPVSVIALLPDNPPAKILWQKRAINVLHASGPERIEHEWWADSIEPYRDYFYIEDERGKRLWVYSSGEPKQWFIHGVFG